MLNTIRKVDSVLTLFTELHPEWGVREMAGELGVPRSNVYELVSSLAGIGLLERTPDRRYRLGWRLLQLSDHLVKSTDVVRIGTGVVHQLATQLGQTAGLATWESGQVLCLEQIEPRGSIPIARVGDRPPVHSTAPGKIALSHGIVDLEGTLERFTPRTITDEILLRQQLSVVRRNDVAFDLGETDPSVRCIAAPIRDTRSGVVLAAVTLCVAPTQFVRDGERYTRSTIGAARWISALLSSNNTADSKTRSNRTAARTPQQLHLSRRLPLLQFDGRRHAAQPPAK
nr:IclR family transcriptional regulator [Pseudonocardia spinosispora]